MYRLRYMRTESSVPTRLLSFGIALVLSLSAMLASFSVATAAPSLLDQCVASINETGFTKQFILDETGFASEELLLSAVSAGSWTIQISTGSGWSPTLRGMSPDIYCGDSGNNTVSQLDSHPSGSHDYFFGGAGNDTVDSMWDSRYWGGSGDDRINNNRERSIFYGGPGTDVCGNRESAGDYIATCIEDGGPLATQAALNFVANTLLIGNTLALSTSGGSGSGAVSFSLVSAGSAGCSIATDVLSATAAGTCTVSATKLGDATYSAATTGSVTVTVSKRDQAALLITDVTTRLGSTLALSTSGGSGSGAVSFSLVSAGTAGCSLTTNVLSVTSAGTCTVSATKEFDATYSAATTGSVTVTVSKRDQAALLIADVTTRLGSSLVLSTTGGSGSGAVSFSLVSAGSAGCTLTSGTLTATTVGTCTVSATKEFDATYDAVRSANTTITVSAPPVVNTTTTTVAPVLDIVVVAPSTTIAPVGQSQVAFVSSQSTTTTVAPKGVVTTSTTSTPTTTTTTTSVPTKSSETVAPKAPSAPSVVAGAAAIQVGDKTETATIERANNQLVVSAGALKAVLSGLKADGTQMPLDGEGNVRLNSGDTMRIRLSGFAPGSTVEAWLFSTPVLLGSVKVGPDGTVIGTFSVPKKAPSGAHRIVIVAKTTDGKPATLTVGINVGKWDSGPGVAVWLIVLPIVLAVVGALVVPATRRRRKATQG